MGNAAGSAAKGSAKAVGKAAQAKGWRPEIKMPPLPSPLTQVSGVVEAESAKTQKILDSFAPGGDAVPSASAPVQPSLQAIKDRIDASRPGLFARLDAPPEPRQGTRDESGDRTGFDETTPIDAEGAEIANRVSGGGAVSVQRVVSSGPRAGTHIHHKNITTVDNVMEMDGAISSHVDDSVGTRNFKLFEAMQLVSLCVCAPGILVSLRTVCLVCVHAMRS